jgi:DmsE family decaheme c-type cytochrome
MHLGIIVFVVFGALLSSVRQQANDHPTLVGNDTCLACHDIEDQYSRTPHARVDCESCHSPGSRHVDSGGEFIADVSFRVRTEQWATSQCMDCHGRQPGLAGFHRGAHGRNNVSCASCHRMHPERPIFALLRADQTTLCSDCHRSARADFMKPYRHPVLEGAMTCSSCHNVHIEEVRPMRTLAAAGPAEECVACHTDKRGPFLFEHVPVQTEGCQQCHHAHGSINPRLLRRTQMHQLCLECHTFTPGVLGSQPPSFHDIRSPRFRNCTTCHREIHGSHADRLFLR